MTTPAITEILNIAHSPAWMPWAVSYFFFIGLAVSAAFISLMGTLLGRPGWEKASRAAAIVMMTCAITAPIALLGDLHQPGRFWHFYTNFTPWSWMSWGAFFLPLFVVLAVVYGWLVLNPRGPFAWALRPLALATAIMAALVALYTGMEVMIIKARPLWNTAFLPFFYLFTGLTGAAGLALLFNCAAQHQDETARTKLARAMSLFAWLSLATLGLWFMAGVTGLSDPAARALTAMSGDPRWLSLAAGLAVLLIVPALAGVVCKRGWVLALTGIAAASAAWLFRWIVFMDGQMIPKTGAGTYVWRIPAGSEGWLGIIGVFGLWLFVSIVIAGFLFRADSDRAARATPAE